MDLEKKRIHEPVLVKEVIKYLNPKSNENFIDATLGLGGHTEEIVNFIKPNGIILGIEKDEDITQYLKPTPNLIIEIGNYINMASFVKKNNLKEINGVLFDFGISSFHLEHSKKGFSFLRDEPLNMCFSKGINETAYDIVNKYSFKDLESILKNYGEEHFASRISKAICESRKNKKIETTFDLINIIKNAVPRWYTKRRKHFATKTFQALRIKVNNELENIKKGIEEACKLVQSYGTIVTISYHSLEHRIVKDVFKDQTKKGFGKILTKSAVKPIRNEILNNPRARSALLRAWQKS